MKVKTEKPIKQKNRVFFLKFFFWVMKVKTEKPKYADKRRETIFKKRKRKRQKKKKKE